MTDLTPRQARFVEEYLVDLNATQAAVRAGYSDKAASQEGSRLLTNVKVADAIAIAQAERSARTHVTQDRVVQELAILAFSDMNDFVDVSPDGVRIKDISELPDDKRRALHEASETTTEHGGTIRVKVHDKKAALDSLGRHLGMFVDRQHFTGEGFQITINKVPK